jgi:ferric-dicitrate binding protein FerR (iron transport regulator)
MSENDIDGEKMFRYFRGEHTKENENYVNQVFNSTDEEQELEHLLRRQWYELLCEDDLKDKDLNHVLCKIHYDINTNSNKFESKWSFKNFIKWSSRIAALLFLPLAIHYCIQTFVPENETKLAWVEITAPAWTRAQFFLPDGTTGWLNSNSRIRYNENYIDNREVQLTGEAYFDVNTNPGNPFEVFTDEISVTVLGTRFNIASYENEKDVEVVLERGELIFNNINKNESYTMKPNDLVLYDKNTDGFSTEIVEPQKYMAWTEGKLVFRNDPLDVIARRLERWYNVDVELNGFMAEDLRLRATFVDENLGRF